MRTIHFANLVGIWRAGTLLDAGRFTQQDGSRWSLGDKRETTVAVDRNDDGDGQSGFCTLGLRIKCLAELHDIDAVLAQRGTYGWRRIRLARRDLQLDIAGNFLGHCNFLSSSNAAFKPQLLVLFFNRVSVARATGPVIQDFSTCPKSNSTGVDRPRICTPTWIRLFS